MGKRDSLRRRRPYRDSLARILIACEGKVTEPSYFNEIRHLARIPIELVIRAGAVPKTLVEWAVKLKKDALRKARKQKDDNQRYDQVWCVFDIDGHPFVPESKQQARDNGIELAISNPCFELWVLLHFRDQTSYIERGHLRHECKKFIPDYDKQLPAAKLLKLYPEALRRARELDESQRKRGCDGDNPSTGVFKLMEQIETLGRKRG